MNKDIVLSIVQTLLNLRVEFTGEKNVPVKDPYPSHPIDKRTNLSYHITCICVKKDFAR